MKHISSLFKGKRSLIVLLLYILVALIAVVIDSDSLAAATDINNTYKAPFEHPDYLLGTDGLGRSVLYGLINGTKITLFIAITTSVLALVIGLVFAFLSAYYGDEKIKLNWPSFIGFILISFISIFYLVYSSYTLTWISIWFFLTVGLFYADSKSFHKFRVISVPFDSMILKILELLKTLPGIFIVLFFLSLFGTRNIWTLILLITFVRTPIIIRLGRSEILKLKNQEYILAAEGMGIGAFRLFFSHMVPNIIAPIRTYLVYGLAATVLIESILSFLGLGLPLDVVTWGSMLSSSRQFFSAWWLAIFPGLAIFILIYSLRRYFISRTEGQEYLYI